MIKHHIALQWSPISTFNACEQCLSKKIRRGCHWVLANSESIWNDKRIQMDDKPLLGPLGDFSKILVSGCDSSPLHLWHGVSTVSQPWEC